MKITSNVKNDGRQLPIAVGRRVNRRTAGKAFAAGRDIAVSNSGVKVLDIFRTSTVHNRGTTTWSSLTEQVTTWSNRYPNQAFYLVEYSTSGVL